MAAEIPFTPHHLIDLTRVSGVTVSPTGRWVAWLETKRQGEKRINSICATLLGTDNTPCARVSVASPRPAKVDNVLPAAQAGADAAASVAGAVFAVRRPDSAGCCTLHFVVHHQLHAVSFPPICDDGAVLQARAVTALDVGVGEFVVSPDGRHVIISHNTREGATRLEPPSPPQAPPATGELSSLHSTGTLHTELPVYHWTAYEVPDCWDHWWILSLPATPDGAPATGDDARDLCAGVRNHCPPCVLGDGGREGRQKNGVGDQRTAPPTGFEPALAAGGNFLLITSPRTDHSRPFGDASAACFSPDSRFVVFVTRSEMDSARMWTVAHGLWVVAATTATDAATATATPHNVMPGHCGVLQAPAFSPDGKFFSVLCMDEEGYESDQSRLLVCDASMVVPRDVGAHVPTARGEIRAAATVVGGEWEQTVCEYKWRTATALVLTTMHLGQQPLFVVDVATATTPRVVVANGAVRSLGCGGASSSNESGGDGGGSDGVVALVYSTASAVPEVLVVDTSAIRAPTTAAPTTAPTDAAAAVTGGGCAAGGGADVAIAALRLTDIASELRGVRLNACTQFSFDGAHGDRVYGFLCLPDPVRFPGRRPGLLMVHGGPEGSFSNVWHSRGWNMQAWAAIGVAVITIDFHGSVGYGNQFKRAIRGDWGGAPLVDLERGLDFVIAQHSAVIDDSRLAVMGGSFGGYMVTWILGQEFARRFRCTMAHAAVFDLRMNGIGTEELFFAEWEHCGSMTDANIDGFDKHNPTAHCHRWHTPTLVIHGELDFRVPFVQGIALFNALQRRRVPSQFLRFPNEGHWISSPSNMLHWHEVVEAWLRRWLELPR